MRRDAAVTGREVQDDQRPGHLRLRDHRPRAFARHAAAVQQNLGSLQRKIGWRGRPRMCRRVRDAYIGQRETLRAWTDHDSILRLPNLQIAGPSVLHGIHAKGAVLRFGDRDVL